MPWREVAAAVEQPDADERHAELGRRLQVVAGKDAEPAAVDRQRLLDPELHREVGDAGALVRRRAVSLHQVLCSLCMRRASYRLGQPARASQPKVPAKGSSANGEPRPPTRLPLPSTAAVLVSAATVCLGDTRRSTWNPRDEASQRDKLPAEGGGSRRTGVARGARNSVSSGCPRRAAARIAYENSPLAEAEAPDRVSRHVAALLESAIQSAPDGTQAAEAVRLARQLLTLLGELVPGFAVSPEIPTEPGQVLEAVLRRQPDGTALEIERPLTPLLDTTVFTNAPGEPAVGHELRAEIASAESIDVVMAFIRWSGVRPLFDALGRHCVRENPSAF